MADLRPISTKQWLVTVSGLSGYFTKVTAPKITKGETEYNDGQAGIQRTHLDFIKFEKVTVSKTFDPKADKAILLWAIDTFDTGETFDITLQPVKADQQGNPIPGAVTIVITKAQLSGLVYPEADRGGSGMSVFELEIIPGSITAQ